LAKRLSKPALAGYHDHMNDEARKQPQNLMIIAIGGVFLLLCLAAFLGWIVQGPEMLLTMAENGMSWCF
jgi:Tfp pilus assembly protein PilN